MSRVYLIVLLLHKTESNTARVSIKTVEAELTPRETIHADSLRSA